MLVRLLFGARVGQVMDVLPESAHAMLADGRAELPDTIPVVTEQVAARVDRGLPRGRKAAVR